MRYLGNKSKLLPHIAQAASRLGFSKGTVCDLFAGSGVVGRFFRERGCRVLSTDLMQSSYLFQRLFLELQSPPNFSRLGQSLDLPALSTVATKGLPAGDWSPLLAVLAQLESLPEQVGLFTRQYSPKGEAARLFLSSENAGRIDAMIAAVREWRSKNLIDDQERDLLAATILDGLDRRANISGTYGAYLKSWQESAIKKLSLRIPRMAWGPRGQANNREASDWLPEVEADLLYMDPPYNNRQYAANYHLFEVLAKAMHCDDPAALEQSIYGKTGLIPWQDRSSKLCSKRGQECRDAFHQLLMSTSIPRVVISYSEEGIITRQEFEEMLAEYAGVARADLGEVLTEVVHSRFRSDADGRRANNGQPREYKQLDGRGRNQVHEWLFHVKKTGKNIL